MSMPTLKEIPLDKVFNCYMDGTETNFFDCQDHCMHFQGEARSMKENLSWWGCEWEELKA